jgi:hypothetical protein
VNGAVRLNPCTLAISDLVVESLVLTAPADANTKATTGNIILIAKDFIILKFKN